MKTIYIFLFMAYCLTASAQEKEAVQKTVIGFFDELANQNPGGLKQYCFDDIQILESGEIWNLDTLVNKINQHKSKDFKRLNRLQFVETQIDGKTAWTTYQNEAVIIKNGKNFQVRWLETAILKKQQKKWKIRVLHSTQLEQH